MRIVLGDGACDSEGCAEAAPQSGLPESQTIQNHLASGSESDAEFRQNMIRYARNKCMAYLATREDFQDWFSQLTTDQTVAENSACGSFTTNGQMPSDSATGVSEEDASHSTTTYYSRFGGAAENCGSSPQTTMIGGSNANGDTFESPAEVSKYEIISGQTDAEFREICVRYLRNKCMAHLATREEYSNDPVFGIEVPPQIGVAMQTTTMTIDMVSTNTTMHDDFHGDDAAYIMGGWARFGGSAEKLKSYFEPSATVQSEKEDEERHHWNAS